MKIKQISKSDFVGVFKYEGSIEREINLKYLVLYLRNLNMITKRWWTI